MTNSSTERNSKLYSKRLSTTDQTLYNSNHIQQAAKTQSTKNLHVSLTGKNFSPRNML